MEYLLKVNNLKKRYKSGDQEIHALDDVSFNLNRGEFVAVGGPSGSGKTTLLNITGMLEHPDSGSVTFNNSEIVYNNKKHLEDIRKENIGFIFQSFNLIPVLTAYENVELCLLNKKMSKEKRRKLTEEALSEVGLKDRLHHKPNELSGGQQQRVAVARAIVSKPDIIFADEPTANLDTKTAFQILELLKSINAKYKTTFLFSTHDDRVLQYSTRRLHMTDGKITKDEVISK